MGFLIKTILSQFHNWPNLRIVKGTSDFPGHQALDERNGGFYFIIVVAMYVVG